MFLSSLTTSIVLGLAMFGFVVVVVSVVGIATVLHERRIARLVLRANDAENQRRGAAN